jgi:hypothetical protein
MAYAMAHDMPTPPNLQPIHTLLKDREVVVMQGAVAQAAGFFTPEHLLNHMWSALVHKDVLKYMTSELGTVPLDSYEAPLFLEGTSVALGSDGDDLWAPCGDVENFYKYSMSLHVDPASECGGDYELVRYDDTGTTGVYAMPSHLFFKQNWGNWRAVRVAPTSKQQDKRAKAWMHMVEMPRKRPFARRSIREGDIPLHRCGVPSQSDGLEVNEHWKLCYT